VIANPKPIVVNLRNTFSIAQWRKRSC